jgi:hypothetical protein
MGDSKTPDKERKLSVEELESWLGLVEMFSDEHVLLHGAAGEDAMNIRDLQSLLSRSKEALSATEETERLRQLLGASIIRLKELGDTSFSLPQYIGEKK